MRHYFDFVPNATTGAAVPGVIVKLFDASDSLVDIFADESGTAIETVSGVPNGAKTDDDGMFSLYVANGIYTARFYVGDKVLKSIRNVELSQDVTELALGAESGAGLVGTSAGETVQDALDGLSVATRADLAALNPRALKTAYLTESGREGQFICRAGTAPADPLQGIYIASTTVGFYWERMWDGVNGRPEWFHDGGSDWLAALDACYRLCPTTRLGARDYLISDTWVWDVEDRSVLGSGRYNHTGGWGTRITMNDPGKTICQLGYTALPSGFPEQFTYGAGFLKNNTIDDFVIQRLVAPEALPLADAGNKSVGATGLRLKYIYQCRVSRLLVKDNTIGAYAGGVVSTHITDVHVRTDRPNTVGNYDGNCGWYLDGELAYGYPGGNASLYMVRCYTLAGMKNGGTSDAMIPTAIYGQGAMTDQYFDHCEIGGTSNGIIFDGKAFTAYGNHSNISFIRPTLDGIDSVGIHMHGLGYDAAVDIVEPYVAAVGGAGGLFGIAADAGAGITITGGKILNNFASGSIGLTNMGACDVRGTKILESSVPMVIDNVDACELRPTIINRIQTGTNAVLIKNSTGTIVAPKIKGNGVVFANGVSMVSCTALQIDASMIPTSYVSSRITLNGTPQGAQGNIGGHVFFSPGGGALQ